MPAVYSAGMLRIKTLLFFYICGISRTSRKVYFLRSKPLSTLFFTHWVHM